MGVNLSLSQLGIGDRSSEESHTARNLAVGSAAAALPFAGMIGQRKLIHDPTRSASAAGVEAWNDAYNMRRAAQPGDVLVTRAAQNGTDTIMTALTGSPYHHVESVLAPDRVMMSGDLHLDPKQFASKELYEKALASQAALPAARKVRYANRVTDLARNSDEMLLLRPKQAPNMPHLETAAMHLAELPHSLTGKGPSAALHEVFVPKLNVVDKIRGLLRGKRDKLICNDTMCSTFTAGVSDAAGTMPRGNPGKALEHAIPPDFLRSPDFDLVGRYVNPEAEQLSEKALKNMRRMGLAGRAGIGLALGAGAYGLTEDPMLAAGAAGAAVTPSVVRAVLNRVSKNPHKGYETLRPVSRAGADIIKRRWGNLRSIGTRTVPVALAGGLAAYLGGKKLYNSLTGD